ncbi:MAG: helix-turn-helix domain-containing protein [Comamonadaceae bacterium]|nr:helix-turn-helix domain-containing protein [Comamonadaceae bacterium]
MQLFNLEQAPRNLPLWDAVLDDLGRPSPARVARALGVGRATVYRWNSSGNVPRTAVLALFLADSLGPLRNRRPGHQRRDHGRPAGTGVERRTHRAARPGRRSGAPQ